MIRLLTHAESMLAAAMLMLTSPGYLRHTLTSFTPLLPPELLSIISIATMRRRYYRHIRRRSISDYRDATTIF